MISKEERGARISAAKIKHGHAQAGRASTEYRTWTQMRGRCLNQSDTAWKDYGGRGICVDDRWSSFENFLADMGLRPSPSHTLDRIDNDGPYSRNNCRWASKKEQARNRRSSTAITFNGVTKTLAEWSETTGIHAGTINTRLRDGWSIERALTTPTRVVRPYLRGKAKRLYLEQLEGKAAE